MKKAQKVRFFIGIQYMFKSIFQNISSGVYIRFHRQLLISALHLNVLILKLNKHFLMF